MSYELIDSSFESLRRDILTKIKTKSEFENVDENDPSLSLFLYVMTYFHSFSMGTITKEFINSFPNISAADELIYSFSNFIGMNTSRKVSAAGKVKFYIPLAHNKQIIIPIGTEIANASGTIIFSTTETKYINVGETDVEVSVIQGQWKTKDETGTGNDNQAYYIYDDVEENNLKVNVSTVDWSEENNFYFSTSIDLHYVVTEIKNGLYVLFHDGKFGKKPANGESIVITYLKTVGLLGNIYTKDIVNTIIGNIYDGDSNKVDNIKVINSDTKIRNGTLTNGSAVVTGLSETDDLIVDAQISGTGIPSSTTIASIDSTTQITMSQNATDDGVKSLTFIDLSFATMQGGTDAHSVDDRKKNISRYFPTNPYITRKQDYKNHLLLHTNVVDCNIYAGWEIYPNDVNKWMTIYAYVVPKNNKYLSPSEKEELYDYIKEKDIFFGKIVFVDCIYIGNDLSFIVKFKESNLSQSKIDEVKDSIATILENYYDFEKAMKTEDTVFRNIYHSELVDKIMNIEEIKKTNLTLQTVEKVSVVANNDLSFIKILDFENLKLEDTYLYLNNENIGAFDGSWNLIPQDNSGSGGIDWTDTGWVGATDRISATINNTTKQITISILDSDLTDQNETGHIVGKIFYARSNAVNDDDITTSVKNLIFEEYIHNITIEN